MPKTCKRCNHRYEGWPAISRVDNKTQICSDCGLDEAMDDYFNKDLTPKSEWPISRPIGN